MLIIIIKGRNQIIDILIDGIVPHNQYYRYQNLGR